MTTILGSYVRMLPYMGKVALKMFGNYSRRCNLCRFSGNFLAFGFPPRFDALCPHCGSIERHRLFGVWLDQNKEEVAGKDVLHFAPESIVTTMVKPLARTYRTADLDPRYGDIVLNIEDIALPDQSVDLIICNHVLEHVNPELALSQLRRILRQGGKLLLMFPIVEGLDETYRNPEITTPRDRDLHFGQDDHLQLFGRDIRITIVKSGLHLTEFTAVEPNVSRYSLIPGDKVFIASRNHI